MSQELFLWTGRQETWIDMGLKKESGSRELVNVGRTFTVSFAAKGSREMG